MSKTGSELRREPSLSRLRAICLALPEAHEKEAWGDPTFRVRDKIFAMHKVGDGRPSMWCKSDVYTRDGLVERSPALFYVPPYVGPKGWLGVRLDQKQLDWALLEKLIRDSYRAIAPKRLAARLTPKPRNEP